MIERWQQMLAETAWLIRAQGVFLLVGIACLACLVVVNSWFVFGVFACGIAIILLRAFAKAKLRCPHCGTPPGGFFGNREPGSVEYCAHCQHWLQNPHPWDVPPPT